MAPKRGESLEPSEERTEFFKKLEDYHEKRGYVERLYSVRSPMIGH